MLPVSRLTKRRIVALLATLSVITLAPAGCSLSSQPQDMDAVDSGSNFYSLTVNITNKSSTQALTLQGLPRVDNQAAMQPGYPTSIPPGGVATYEAINTNNGVQMWLTFVSNDGSTINIDNDVHKTAENSFRYDVNNLSLTFLGESYITGGQRATSTVLIGDCSSMATCNFDPDFAWQHL